MNRQIISVSGVRVGTDIGAYEETLVEEDSLIFWLRIWCRALRVEMVKMEIAYFAGIGSAAQCLYQYVRDTGHTAKVNMVTCPHGFYSVVRCNVHGVFHKKFYVFVVVLLSNTKDSSFLQITAFQRKNL